MIDGFDIIPFGLGEDLALLTKHGWECKVRFYPRVVDVEAGYTVWARRDDYVLHFWYSDDTGQIYDGGLGKYVESIPLEIKSLDRTGIRRIACMTAEQIEKECDG